MTKKVRHTKKTHRKGKRTRAVGKKYSNYHSRISASVHNPIPNRFDAEFETAFFGVLAVGSAATGYFTVLPGLIQAFNQGDAFTAGTMNGTLVPATTALNALSAPGYTQMSALYNSVIIWNSKLTVTMSPTAGADIAQLVIVPFQNEAGAFTSTETGLAMPYSKGIVCTGSNNQAKNTLSVSVNHMRMVGILNKSVYEAEHSGSITGASSLITYKVLYQLFSAAFQPASLLLNAN